MRLKKLKQNTIYFASETKADGLPIKCCSNCEEKFLIVGNDSGRPYASFFYIGDDGYWYFDKPFRIKKSGVFECPYCDAKIRVNINSQ